MWPSGAPDGHIQCVTLPNAVLYNFDLLMMSKVVLETIREIYVYLTYYKTRICALSWSVTKIVLKCTVSKTS